MDCKELRNIIILLKYTDYSKNTSQFVEMVHIASYILKNHYQIQEISMFLKFQMLEFLNKDQMCVVDPENIFIHITNYNTPGINIQTNPEHLLKSIADCKTSRYTMVFVKLQPDNIYADNHANTVIIDTLSTPMKAWRIEPNVTDEWLRVRNKIFKRRTHTLKENIIEQLTPPEQDVLIKGYTEYINDALRKYLEQIGIMYFNEFPETCGIQHGGLCAYVSVIQFFEGKQISLPVIKEYILNYFIWEYHKLCGKGIKFKNAMTELENIMTELENIIKPFNFKVQGNKLTLKTYEGFGEKEYIFYLK